MRLAMSFYSVLVQMTLLSAVLREILLWLYMKPSHALHCLLLQQGYIDCHILSAEG